MLWTGRGDGLCSVVLCSVVLCCVVLCCVVLRVLCVLGGGVEAQGIIYQVDETCDIAMQPTFFRMSCNDR